MLLVNAKKIFALICLLAVPAAALYPRAGYIPEPVIAASPQSLESYVRANLPFSEELHSLSVGIRYFGGDREQNGVFIGENVLIKNIPEPIHGVVEANNVAVLEFARELRARDLPFYFALIPTSAGVLRQFLPNFAETVDQRHFIESVYNRMSGRMTTVDVFTPLGANRERYIFYRTENNLTPYGGYYVFEALARRMRAADSPTLSAYSASYADAPFYGDLYSLAPYQHVMPDRLIFLDYSRRGREYMVTHTGADGIKVYHTLFPAHLRQPPDVSKAFLGGLSARVDIVSTAPFSRKLLIFADKTAPAYLPFMVNHYSEITVIDLSWDSVPFGEIEIEDYDQILMAYSVETYTNHFGTPSRIEWFMG
ncbi:MAG: DHHW family protein [Oscillospiraceae bacterium]|nr:DHHW family protein [Oscillospiraceae bacterium]